MSKRNIVTLLSLAAVLTMTSCVSKPTTSSEGNKDSSSTPNITETTSKEDNTQTTSKEDEGGKDSSSTPNITETTSKEDEGNNEESSLTPPSPDTNPHPYDSYYRSITASKGAALKEQLHILISKKNGGSYDKLWSIYKSCDLRPDGKINDIYSNITNFRPGTDQAGNYSKEGDKYNREHCIPKSWWGGSKSNQGSDPFIVLPSDGYVNNRRSSYAFGEVKEVTYKSANGYSKLGSNKYSEGPHTVFEINDEYKGDMARLYFYALTCYNTSSWTSGDGRYVFNSNGNFGLTDYASKLFLKWHFQDPVSDWERQRNDKVQKHTQNRNPYIDHPEWATNIWGTKTF